MPANLSPDQQRKLAAARRVGDALIRLSALIDAAESDGVAFDCTDVDGAPLFYWYEGQTCSGTLAEMRAQFTQTHSLTHGG
ncbi:MAG TPA: hypothetical protein VHI13_12275 [Candidatus Kapabacteria bacterium]|nr:hypothetical protein [Candidatus Kapabacteria bacterium]